MQLNEAINHLNEILNNPNHKWSCNECKQDHQQLYDWLIELQTLRSNKEKN